MYFVLSQVVSSDRKVNPVSVTPSWSGAEIFSLTSC